MERLDLAHGTTKAGTAAQLPHPGDAGGPEPLTPRQLDEVAGGRPPASAGIVVFDGVVGGMPFHLPEAARPWALLLPNRTDGSGPILV